MTHVLTLKLFIRIFPRLAIVGVFFYTPVTVGGIVTLGSIMDSGSMACSICETEMRLRGAGILSDQNQSDVNVILIGCGGSWNKPEVCF